MQTAIRASANNYTYIHANIYKHKIAFTLETGAFF